MKPIIGITSGCPCGIGPEIVAKAIADERVLEICTPRVFGICSGKASFATTKRSPNECGSISMQAVDDAVRAVISGEISAIVTAPINKSHWRATGCRFEGHTEYLAYISSTKSVAMMMVSPRLTISLVTTHLPLADVPKTITKERICEVARLTSSYFNHHAKIAVCALNPHSGDNGIFGAEEKEIIAPAVKQLQSQGLDVSGPWPADTVFWKAINKDFDAVVAMYHDQAIAPIKTLDFKHTVNVTLGLPFIRTSPDHGTAEDIAGKGIADHTSIVEAIKLAEKLCHKSNLAQTVGAR